MSPTPPSVARRVLGWGLLGAAPLALASAYVTIERAAGTYGEAQQRQLALLLLAAAIGLWMLSGALRGRRPHSPLQLALLLAVAVVGGSLGLQVLDATSHDPRQRTLSTLRDLGSAIAAFQADNGRCPLGRDVGELGRELVPTYRQRLEASDGWGFPLRYEIVAAPQGEQCALGSGGKGGAWEHERLADYGPAPASALEDDLVWRDGAFVRPAETAER